MDIPVSDLNQRMALQLPAEIPLGLVFVVGKASGLVPSADGNGLGGFHLAEGDHRLRCRLSERAASEASVNDGDMVRAGGHLAFDPIHADYYLLARDVELMPEQRLSHSGLSAILADMNERSQSAGLAPAELPVWVRQMIPPELRAELMASGGIIAASAASEAGEPLQTLVDVEGSDSLYAEEPASGGLTEEMIQFLTEAIDSPEDVELTSELIAEIDPTARPEQLTQLSTGAAQVGNAQAERIQKRAIPGRRKKAKAKAIPWPIVILVVMALLLFLVTALFLAIALWPI